MDLLKKNIYASCVSLTHTILHDGSVIHVTTEGSFDFLKAFEMWEEIAKACEENDCFRILGISKLNEPIPTMDAYDHLSMLQSVGINNKHRIAWVAARPELLERLRVAETVLRNRGSINIRVFDAKKAAKRWIAEDGD